MAKGVVEVNGEDVLVREDTYKAYRGVRWAILTIAIMAAIVAVLFFTGVITSLRDGKLNSPAQSERPAQ
ncbi:MAG TPA: hypothetical protein VGO43_03045 [Pyrinomonadaceae bacterium]|jgi:hypothetical protein|nr:hypothetical protein [Pyrinomonadaceae bacterium]